jgi:hypothetical protein
VGCVAQSAPLALSEYPPSLEPGNVVVELGGWRVFTTRCKAPTLSSRSTMSSVEDHVDRMSFRICVQCLNSMPS